MSAMHLCPTAGLLIPSHVPNAAHLNELLAEARLSTHRDIRVIAYEWTERRRLRKVTQRIFSVMVMVDGTALAEEVAVLPLAEHSAYCDEFQLAAFLKGLAVGMAVGHPAYDRPAKQTCGASQQQEAYP